MDYKRLSKTIAYALRHAPAEYGLELDEEGWVQVKDLLAALRPRRREWQTLTQDDLVMMVERASKSRYELQDGRIRALYGHSVPNRIPKEPSEPPEILYHGTSPEAVNIILAEGLKPMQRQYIHLAADQETAHRVGSRKSSRPVLLKIHALEAHRAGIAFYHGNDETWLADIVPPQFIERPID